MDHLLQHFHLQHTHGTLSLTPSLLFTRPQTNQRPRPRPKAQYIILGPYPLYIYIYILDDEALICILKHRIPNLVDHFNFISWGWFQIISHTFRSLELSHALKNVLIQASHKLYMTLMAVAEPHTQVGGPRPPQNFKKLIYSMYIIYILKNVACKN